MTDNKAGGQAMDGNGDGFRELYERHRAGVYGIALRYAGSAQDAEDILQDTFIKAFKGLARFERSGNPNAAAWINRLCFHRCIEHLRRQKRRKTDRGGLSEIEALFGASGPGPERAAEVAGLMAKVRQSLGALSPRQRIVFDLRYFGHHDVLDIAVMLGCSESAVKTNLARAAAKLRDNLAPIMEEL